MDTKGAVGIMSIPTTPLPVGRYDDGSDGQLLTYYGAGSYVKKAVRKAEA